MKTTLSRLRRFLRTRRRLLAALLAGLAVWAGLTALRPAPPTTVPVLVAARAITGGAIIQPADVVVRDLPEDAQPDAFLTGIDQAVGKPATLPLPSGAVLMPASVVSRDSLASPGMAVLPVVLTDTAAGLIEVGDRIDLIGSDGDHTATVASGARVVAVLGADANGSALSSTRSTGPTVLVELRPDALVAVAAAAAQGPLGFGFR